MNMFKPTNAKNREEYIAALEPTRKTIIVALDKLIQETIPSQKPWFASNMLGYGAFDYRDYKKNNIKWPLVALASQKHYVSLYVCAVDAGKYLAEQYKDKLGKVSVGKSCIRFKKLDDINQSELKKLLRAAQQHPGFDIDK